MGHGTRDTGHGIGGAIRCTLLCATRYVGQALYAILVPAAMVFLTSAYAAGTGTSGAILLTQPVGARALGMSEAYTAADGDVLGVHYNPACWFGWQGTLLYQRGIADDGFGLLAFGCPTPVGRFAGSLLYYSAGEMELISALGERRMVNAQKDYLSTISYAYSLGFISLGSSVKLLRSELVERVSGSAFAVDFGGMMRFPGGPRIGLAFLNVGSGLKYIEQADSLPLTARLGLSGEIVKSASVILTAAVDAVKINDGGPKAHLGLECKIVETFALRAGYRIGYDSAGLTAGFGFERVGMSFDYALSMMGEFSAGHYAGLSYRFGSSAGGEEQVEPLGSSLQQAGYSFPAAKAAFKRGDCSEAVRILSQPHSSAAEDEGFFILLANSYYRLGQYEKSLECYQRALEFNPANAELRTFVQRLRGLLGR